MKLSKQERIGVLIIAIILIIGLGTWLYIVPKIKTVQQSNITLEATQTDLETKQARAATKDDLKKAVMDAYNEGSNNADMFFEEMTAYEADQEFRAFLDQCKTNMLVEDFSVSEPGVSTLAPLYFVENEVEYDLKTYVTQGVEPTEAELATEQRWNAVKELLGSSQKVGSISIDFTVSALTPEEIMAFCDEINSYVKTENEKSTRKACMISGMALSYELNEEAYDELMVEIEEKANKSAIEALYKEFGMKVPADLLPNEEEKEEEEETLNPEDYVYSLDTTITFYSVERMQDPTEQLEAQEK